MKFLILSVLLVCGIAHVGIAQAPPPPPPPLIWSPPVATDLAELLDSENGFKATFPGQPKKSSAVANGLSLVTYNIYRKGSTSTVTIVSFPEDIESRAPAFYESYKENLSVGASTAPGRSRNKKFILNFDREIEVSGIKAREFGYVYDYYFTQVAVLIVGNLVYEVKSDVTNWHILSDSNSEVVKEFTKEAERFRNSFSLTK